MTPKVARLLSLLVFLGLGCGLVAVPVTSSAIGASLLGDQSEHTVFLAGNLTHDKLITLTSGLSACGHRGVLLLDSTKSSPYHKLFLNAFQPQRVVPIGAFSSHVVDLEERLNIKAAPPIEWKRGPPWELWRGLFARAETVVVCPAEPYRLLLQAACLAGVAQAPLFVVHGDGNEGKVLRQLMSDWHTTTIYAVGAVPKVWRGTPELRVVRFADEESVAAAYLRRQLKNGPIKSLVVANPTDVNRSAGVMSPLAPWITLKKRGLLLLTNDAGDNAGALVQAALQNRALQHTENLILVADLQAIPMERRPNPFADGKDPYIEMEPLTPRGHQPYTFATGRLFNEDPSVVALVLAREKLLARQRRSERRKHPRALVASNSGGSLPLLETFSQNTAKELRNCGYDTTTLFGLQVNKVDLRRLLPDQDVFLWEGHHNTLIKDYQLPEWSEPLQPSLLFIQSCLALKDYKAQPLLERGALCVVGSSTRIFSASGGAFALSFFDALLYSKQSMGGSLRQAKNFLVTYAMLKEKRFGKDARLTAANLRSAWAFTLWGDPTLQLPSPESPEDALPPVRHRVQGNTIVVTLPNTAHEKAATTKYKAQMLPNGRLAGLVTKEPDENLQPLVPFVFVEVALPQAPADKTPELSSKIPSRRWAFCWDSRRKSGYLLVMPRTEDRDELRFRIAWQTSGSERTVRTDGVTVHGQ